MDVGISVSTTAGDFIVISTFFFLLPPLPLWVVFELAGGGSKG